MGRPSCAQFTSSRPFRSKVSISCYCWRGVAKRFVLPPKRQLETQQRYFTFVQVYFSDTGVSFSDAVISKQSRSLARSSPKSIPHSLPVPALIQTPPLPAQAQVVTMRDRDWDKAPEVVLHRPTADLNLGPPPSPSHGKRLKGMGVPRRGPEKVAAHPSQVRSLHPRRGRSTSRDGEIV